MRQFRKRSAHPFTAEQFDGSDAQGDMLAATSGGRIVAARGALFVRTTQGIKQAKQGDWIMDSTGSYQVFSDDDFLELYEEVPS